MRSVGSLVVEISKVLCFTQQHCKLVVVLITCFNTVQLKLKHNNNNTVMYSKMKIFALGLFRAAFFL